MARPRYDIEKLTIGEWLSRLTPAQAVGITATVGTLIAVAFGLGWAIPQFVGDAENARLTAENVRLNARVDDLMQNVLATKRQADKETYLALYLRCLLADQSGNSEQLAEAKTAFTKFVTALYESKSEGVLHFGKSASPSEATITFSDSTTWPLPKDFLIQSDSLPPVVVDPDQLRKQAAEREKSHL